MIQLKPCPFCGKIKCVRIRVYPSNDLKRIDEYSVVCDHVHGGCGSESGHYITAENAIKAWNKRKTGATVIGTVQGSVVIQKGQNNKHIVNNGTMTMTFGKG